MYLYRTGDPSSLSFNIVTKEGGWKNRLNKAKQFLQDRTAKGLNSLQIVVVDDDSYRYRFSNVIVINKEKFNCSMCIDPGRTQMYISKDGIVKKCPFAKYHRGRIDRYILFNIGEHKCMEKKT